MMSSSSASSCAASFGIETNPAREVGAHTDLTYFQDLILRHSSQYEQETTLGSTIPWSSGLTPFRQPTDELRPNDLQNGVLQAQISARKQPISSDTTDIESFVHATGRVFDGDECWHPAISYRNPLAEGVTLVTFNPGLQFQAKSRDTREDLSSKSLIIPAKLSLLQDLRADISLKEDFPQLIRCPNADHEETMKEERGARQWIAASERLRSVSSEIVFPSVLSQAQSCASSIESPNSISFDNNKSKILFASSKEKLQQATLSENISNRNLNSLEFAQENGRSLSRNLEGIDDDVGIDNKRSITKLLDSHYGDMDGYLKKSRLADPTPSIPLKTQTIQTHVRKEKLSDRITALQQLVSPFGKTDTASVLLEAIGYIKFLQEQVQVLSSPYMKPKSHQDFIQVSLNGKVDGSEPDLRSRGLCLMPVSCTLNVANTNGADYWASGMGGGNRY